MAIILRDAIQGQRYYYAPRKHLVEVESLCPQTGEGIIRVVRTGGGIGAFFNQDGKVFRLSDTTTLYTAQDELAENKVKATRINDYSFLNLKHAKTTKTHEEKPKAVAKVATPEDELKGLDLFGNRFDTFNKIAKAKGGNNE